MSGLLLVFKNLVYIILDKLINKGSFMYLLITTII